ncbi:MAG: sensor histidine kinase [Thermodesulfobacteriota bacterium]
MHFRFKYSLLQALLVYVIIPLIAALGVAGYVSLTTLEKQVEKKMQDELQLVARALELPVSRALKRDREGSVNSALESAFRINRVYGASVYDAEGNKVASVGAQKQKNEAKGDKQLAAIAEQGDRQDEYSEVGGEEAYSYFLPLTDSGGRITGLLQLSRKKADFQEYIHGLRKESIIILAAGALVMTILVLFGHRRALGRHLENLGRSMRRVEQGDRRHRLYMQGPREIIAVASAFNNMLDSMDRAQEELEQQRLNRARLEDELRKAEKMAAIGRLAAGVAHELGSPLSVVDGHAQRAFRLPDLSDQAARAFKHIREQVGRMELIVRQLLDFSRQNVSNKRCVDPGQISLSAIQTLSRQRSDWADRIQYAGSERECKIMGDPLRLEQLLTNLLKNALQASPDGLVRLEWNCDERECLLIVQDDGPGIDDQMRDRVCDPFFTTKPPGEGTGLGLAVVHGIVEEHFGEMHIRSSPWGGAEFEIRLPVHAPEDEQSAPVPEQEKSVDKRKI